MDPGQLDQVIFNLVVNARDAMPGGGRLVIATRNVAAADAPNVTGNAQLKDDLVEVSVSDDGIGMDAMTRAHIFEPFFTTKAPGMGTGLGLATVYGIVSQSGGFIRVDSELGQGTTMRLYLPRVAASVDQPAAPTAAPLSARGTETVLVVEDEPASRALVAQQLTRLGYLVLEAANGQEGVTVASGHAGDIDLIVTDVILPTMSGRAMAELVRRTSRPGIAVLFMSGYTGDAALLRDIASQGLPFLQKPFSLADLGRKVREVLDAAGEGRSRAR